MEPRSLVQTVVLRLTWFRIHAMGRLHHRSLHLEQSLESLVQFSLVKISIAAYQDLLYTFEEIAERIALLLLGSDIS